MSTYVIGDLQGCFEELQKLLTTVQFREDRDALWLCGDIVNRGPESLKCLSYLYSIRENCKIVLGNHDLHLLGIIEGSRSPTESDTLEEVLESSDLIILAEWMKTLPFHHIEKVKSDGMEIEFIMTHAGVPPSWTKQDLLERSEELSKYLSNANSENFLNNIDFYPFKSSSAKLAMTAHILYTKIDSKNVSTFSKKIIKEIIRKKIGYKGILMSDDISMKALKYDLITNAKKSLSAGCNLVLYCAGNIEDNFKLIKSVPYIDEFTIKKTSEIYKILG